MSSKHIRSMKCRKHRLNKIKFRLDDTVPFLEEIGVKYLEDIKGYKKLFSVKYKPTFPWFESLFYLNVNGNLVECPEGFTILSWNDILNAFEEYNIPFNDLSNTDNNIVRVDEDSIDDLFVDLKCQ